MAWFFVDDNLDGHPKADETSNAALGLWVRCGALCARNGTDGKLTETQAKRRGSAREIAELVRVGWWIAVDGGYVMHDWAQWQKTADQVAERRAIRAEAGRRGGLKSGSKRSGKNEANAKHLLSKSFDSGEANVNPAPSSSDLRSSELPTPPLPTTSARESASTVVKAFFDACKRHDRTKPTEAVRNRVGQSAKRLLADGVPITELVAAAEAMAQTPYDDLDKQVNLARLPRIPATKGPRRDANLTELGADGRPAWMA